MEYLGRAHGTEIQQVTHRRPRGCRMTFLAHVVCCFATGGFFVIKEIHTVISLDNHNRLVMVLFVKRAAANPVFRALADPTRRAIFEQLTRQGEQTVHALTSGAGVSQPAVSKHLTVLKRARLVRHRREGRETHYRAQPEALAPLVGWLNHYGTFWRDRFDRLENLLTRMDP